MQCHTHSDWLAPLIHHAATAELEVHSSSSVLPGLLAICQTSTKQQLCRTTQLKYCGVLYRQILGGSLTCREHVESSSPLALTPVVPVCTKVAPGRRRPVATLIPASMQALSMQAALLASPWLQHPACLRPVAQAEDDAALAEQIGIGIIKAQECLCMCSQQLPGHFQASPPNACLSVVKLTVGCRIVQFQTLCNSSGCW